jgi:phosphoribosylformylglycinamidine synthase
MAKERAVQEACLEAVEAGIVKSAHDCSEGGLAVALAESCISKKSKMLGATVELDDKIRKDALLFGEAQSRIVVSMPKSKLAALEKIAKRHSVRCKVLGKVGGKRLVIKSGRSTLIDLPVSKLSEAWRNAIPSRLVK